MNEIVDVIVRQLVADYGCRWAAMLQEEGGERTGIASAGEPGTPLDDAVVVPVGAANLVVEYAFRPGASAEMAAGAKILATALIDGYLALRIAADEEGDPTGRILIVDDDVVERKLVRHVLQRDGFTVVEAPNGLVGHARALEFKPALIIIDWMMPVLDGLDAAMRLKADPFTAAIPLVMLTSRSQPQDKVAALAAGVQDFLTKPFAPAALTASVRQQLRWRHLLADDSAQVVAAAPPRPAAAPESADLARFVELAELAEEVRSYDAAAQAYARAADLAVSETRPDIGNKFRRLAGKMYLLHAESAEDPAEIQRGYSSAARAFLAAGNISLAATAHKSAKEAVGPAS